MVKNKPMQSQEEQEVGEMEVEDEVRTVGGGGQSDVQMALEVREKALQELRKKEEKKRAEEEEQREEDRREEERRKEEERKKEERKEEERKEELRKEEKRKEEQDEEEEQVKKDKEEEEESEEESEEEDNGMYGKNHDEYVCAPVRDGFGADSLFDMLSDTEGGGDVSPCREDRTFYRSGKGSG